MGESYTPFLRACAWIALGAGLVVFVGIIVVATSGRAAGLGAGLAFGIGMAVIFQSVLVFALLMVIASMADDLAEIRENTAEPVEARGPEESATLTGG